LPFITSEAQVYVAVAVLQMAAATFTPTFQALIPRIINNQNEYTSALSLSRIAYDLEQILSPVLAAMLLSFASRGQVFAVAAVGFVGSATMIAGSRSLGVDKRESVSRRVREGMVMMLRLPELRGVLALNLALAAPTALVLVNTVVLVRGQLGRSESDVAVLLGACGAGSIVMALLIPHLRLHVTLFGGAGGAVAGLLGFFLLIDAAPTWPVFISLWFVLGMSMSALATPMGQVIRRNVADEELGSVFAAQFSLSHACYMLTYPLAGWCGAALGLGWTSLLLALIAGFALIAAANVWPSVHVGKDV
jgi:H+ antiporter protein